MAVITFANAKGGAGKTTAALILSTELARQGNRVVVLDADPQRWITSWSEVSGRVANLEVISHVTPASLPCHIRELKGGQISSSSTSPVPRTRSLPWRWGCPIMC